MAVAALGSGVGAHEAAARFFLLEESRADVAFAVSLAWMVFVGIAGLLIMAFPKERHRWYRSGVLVVLAFGLPSGFALLPALYTGENGNADNVLLITIDALRADYCSVYGSENPTPNIDAVAERGVVFERAYVTAPWTLPSVYSMCASDYAPLWLPGQDFREWVHRVRTAFFEPEEPTIAERYREKGYHTAFITGNTLLDDRSRLLRGFDDVYIFPIQIGETRNPCAGMPLLGPTVERIRPETARTWPFDSTRRITAYARTFLRHNTGRPYFLWIHYMDPHDPYNPPYAYRDTVTEHAFYPRKPPGSMWDPARKEPDWVKPENKIIIGPEKLYAAEVRYVDDMLGEFIGLADPSTWVIIGADHGEEFWEHGRMSHRNAFYEESVHVPLIVSGPGCVSRRIAPPVSYVDLLPTLAGLTGLEAPDYWQGKNLADLISGKDIPGWERPCFAGCNDATVAPPSVMVVDGDMKLILNLVDGSVELYDLSEDPKERNNLAEAGIPPDAESLQSKAEAWVEEVTERHRTRKAPPPLDAEESEELRKQFEALGYL
ncbi:MAG: sulfatase-like hydrolase/transferase [Candidatus Hydrogenedentota bacterium]